MPSGGVARATVPRMRTVTEQQAGTAHLHLVMVAVMTGLFVGAMDGTIVSTALPTIVGDLGGLSQAPWVGVAFLLAQTVATPIIGRISDIYGRKKTYEVNIVMFLLSSVLCALAQNMTQLVGFRALQGLSAAGLLALPLAIVGDLLPPQERARYQGYTAGTFALAALLGPLVGGFVVDVAPWQCIFLVNLPIGVLSSIAVHRYLVIERPLQRAPIDVVGAFLLTVATCPLIIALLWAGHQWGWTAAGTLAMFATSAVATVAFVVCESRVSGPILSLDLFTDPVVRSTMIGGFVLGIVVYAVNSYTPLFLQVARGASATASGIATVPTMIGVTAASIVSGRLIARSGRYKPFPIVGALLLGVGTVLLATMNKDTSVLDCAARSAVVGLGMGQIGPSLTLIVQNAVPYERLGVATSGLSFIRTLGGVLGSTAIGAVYGNRVEALIPRYVGPEAMATVDVGALQGRPSVIRSLPEPVRSEVIQAFVDAITIALRCAVPVALIAAILFCFIPAIPLRDSK